MTELFESSKSLLTAIERLPPSERDSTIAYCAPELEQLARAIQKTQECIEACEAVAAHLGI